MYIQYIHTHEYNNIFKMSSNCFNKLALTTNLSIDFYINRINNRLVFKIKDGYKLYYLTSRNYKKNK